HGGAGGSGGGGGGGPSIAIMEDRLSGSTRSGNSFALGDAGTGGAGPASNPGADGVSAEFAKLAGAGAALSPFLELVGGTGLVGALE
ncbi:MAG: PE family protein, partial [Longimicrobiales bacterium]